MTQPAPAPQAPGRRASSTCCQHQIRLDHADGAGAELLKVGHAPRVSESADVNVGHLEAEAERSDKTEGCTGSKGLIAAGSMAERAGGWAGQQRLTACQSFTCGGRKELKTTSSTAASTLPIHL